MVAAIAFAVLVLVVVSFLDDLRSLPPLLRVAVHAGAAIIALYALCSGLITMHSPHIAWGIVAAGLLWITGFTNAFNFMDGINGIAGMQILTTGIGTALIGIESGAVIGHPAIVVSFVLAGAGAGFLPHNFPRPRMFLGDVGSVPAGFLLAVLAFWLARDLGWWLLGAFGLLHANFVLDTVITLVRRVSRGDNWSESHREHFYQLLIRAGKTHQSVVELECVIQIIVLLLVLFALKMSWPARAAAAVAICVVWLAFFAYAEFEFRRQGVIRDAT
jgi:UDP-N-acetylmuramyl pentapeptide phosphotransferase/UDP-N-acetylglucosamine-1-phosphate transferase